MKKDCKVLDWRIYEYYGWDILFRTVDSIMTVLCFQERAEEGTVHSVTAELLGSGLHS